MVKLTKRSTSSHITGTVKKNTTHEFLIKNRLTKKQIYQLIKNSRNDSEIVKFTSDSKRFADHNSYKKWRAKGRTTYVLEDRLGNLGGIIWYGKRNLLDEKGIKCRLGFNPHFYGITFAIRLYLPARGLGMSTLFIETIQRKYCSTREYKSERNNGIWLGTKKGNMIAQKLYLNVGCKIIGKSHNEVYMVFPK